MTDIVVGWLIITITGVKNLSKNVCLIFVRFTKGIECFHGHFHSLDGELWHFLKSIAKMTHSE